MFYAPSLATMGIFNKGPGFVVLQDVALRFVGAE